MWPQPKPLFVLFVCTLIVIKAYVSALAIDQQTTKEKHKWIFECGTSKIPCDTRTEFCEERMDQCIHCFEYCSDARIKGHANYQAQCYKHCSVYMRDKENEKSRKLDNQANIFVQRVQMMVPTTNTTTDGNQQTGTTQMSTMKIAFIIVTPIVFCVAVVVMVIRKYPICVNRKRKGPKECERNTETLMEMLKTDGGRDLRTEGSRQGSSIPDGQHQHGVHDTPTGNSLNSDVANLNDFNETEHQDDGRTLGD
ncbi:unnamed protein product [Owenia fusiformis]|uniref:Uncharacterized protein n=1 Tax=Owenia fusiformis TaxID=6347 RepID=A0A8S4PTV1_OWEFU|nr:unnamed protein product [Owenia fusiformis]